MDIGNYRIRKAAPEDAEGIAAVLAEVAAERVYSAILAAWPVEEQRAYLSSLSAREAFHVAEDRNGEILAHQSLDLYSPALPSMSHVASIGTFVRPAARGFGIGKALWIATHSFARATHYRKAVIQVRASNAPALAFYRSLGFTDCGRLRDQVCIDGIFDDEMLLERLLNPPGEAS